MSFAAFRPPVPGSIRSSSPMPKQRLVITPFAGHSAPPVLLAKRTSIEGYPCQANFDCPSCARNAGKKPAGTGTTLMTQGTPFRGKRLTSH